jgi:hypothetical protein
MGDSRLCPDNVFPDALAIQRQALKADAGSPKAGVHSGKTVLLDCRRQGPQVALATLEQPHRIRFISNVKT